MTLAPTSLTISSALAAMRRGELKPLDLAEACLQRIARLNPPLNAFISPTPEIAARAALAAQSLLDSRPPNLERIALLGIPVAVKDLIDVAGVRTTAGSKFFGDTLPGEDAPAVLNLRLAGAVVVGKTNTHEIALGVTGVNPHFGAVGNPWDPSRVSGGSSSGSAVAVATGMCLGALGTDTGGSIRIPASLCGIVGLKPTYGRVSTRGVVPLSWNLDHVGPLARTVDDAALLLSVLAGFDTHDPASANQPVDDYLAHLNDGIRGWRVALAVGEYVEVSDAPVLKAVQVAADLLRDLGAAVEPVNLDWLKEAALANGQMTQADAAAFHRQRLASHPENFGADVLQRLQAGAALTSTEYSLARRVQAESRRRFEQFFEKYDLLVLPSTPIPAPPIEGTGAVEAAGRLTRFTAPFNLAGLPAISVPCGFSEAGLPYGLQLVAKHWDEARLLRAARAYESATEWHDQTPCVLTT
jgi:aspartyl-tRNA(Asn)/glutamyl-tRNA(Gln) amidotransferase subunit A